MRHRVSCGVIPVYIKEDGTVTFLLVQGYGRYWGFPKGGKKEGETHKETAERELFEETQLVCDSFVENALYTERYLIPKKRGSNIMKKVIYYVGIMKNTNVVRQTTELRNHGWFTFEEAQKKLIDNRSILLEKIYRRMKEND